MDDFILKFVLPVGVIILLFIILVILDYQNRKQYSGILGRIDTIENFLRGLK